MSKINRLTNNKSIQEKTVEFHTTIELFQLFLKNKRRAISRL
jgi:hypothetical protein